MVNRGLIFIPDISGFSRFVNETEIDHSRLIIQELLEILINANNTGLQISEIEGDAILFYRFGEPPSLPSLYSQVEKMFQEFHKSLIAYDHLKYCQCKACRSVLDLTLKIITHYGEFTGYKVKEFSKLIGKDLIVAHQLLKNDIPEHEYWLVTKDVVGGGKPNKFVDGMEWNESAKHTESGDIPFHYVHLGLLKKDLQADYNRKPDFDQKTKVVSLSTQYPTDIITLFHATGDFQYRARWQEGVKRVEELAHILPRIGMKCRCILDSGATYVYSSSYHYADERIEFSETDDKGNITYFTLNKSDDTNTGLKLEYYISKSLSSRLLYGLTRKKKIELRLRKSLENLGRLVKDLDFKVVNN